MKLVRGACQLLLLLSSTTYGVHAKDASNANEERKEKIRTRKVQEDAKKPNILLIVADDVGTSDIPYWGDNIVPMENIEKKLKSKGVTFYNAHSSPLCAPSRYMILSGNYPHRGLQKGGAWNFSAEQNQFIGDQKSIAEVLKEQFNYHTGMYGKWHIGGRVPAGGTYSNDKSRPLSCCDIDWNQPMEDGPNDIGFDESFYTMGGIQSAPYSFFRNGYLQTNINDIKFWEEGTYATVNDNGESIIDKPGEGDPNWDSTEYNTRIVKEVDDFLANHDTTDPFFLYVGLGQVHIPHSPPKFYNGTPVEGVFGDPHLDLLYEMDLVVGSLMSSVEDRGLLENTLVIFVSDNGGLNGLDHTDDHDRHFRGAKGSVWEGGYTVPLIMRYDGVLPQQSNRTGLVGINDIYATLADFVGFDIPDGSAQDSISFARHANSIYEDSNRKYMGVWSWKNKPAQAIRDGDFKYVIRYADTKEEYLFFLPSDVKEQRNLLRGDQVSSFYKRIRNELDDELRRIGFCPKDVDEPFKIPYGPDEGNQVTCNYFKADRTRCETQFIGEVNCNSVCGRFRKFCDYYEINFPVTYPDNEIPETECLDSKSFTFTTNLGQTENCSWISKKAVRIEKYCPDAKIASKCSLTCDQCDKDIDTVPTSAPECQDDGDFQFVRLDGTNGSCEWLSKNFRRPIKFCPTPSIASACKLTCNNCSGDVDQEDNSSPTQSPVKASVTNSPTTSVSKQYFPFIRFIFIFTVHKIHLFSL